MMHDRTVRSHHPKKKSNDIDGGIHTFSQYTYLLGLHDCAVSVPAEDFISAQTPYECREWARSRWRNFKLYLAGSAITLYTMQACVPIHMHTRTTTRKIPASPSSHKIIKKTSVHEDVEHAMLGKARSQGWHLSSYALTTHIITLGVEAFWSIHDYSSE